MPALRNADAFLSGRHAERQEQLRLEAIAQIERDLAALPLEPRPEPERQAQPPSADDDLADMRLATRALVFEVAPKR